MRLFNIYRKTTNSRNYKLAHYTYVLKVSNKCNFCPPHSGCNGIAGRKEKTWKKNKKRHQWN